MNTIATFVGVATFILITAIFFAAGTKAIPTRRINSKLTVFGGAFAIFGISFIAQRIWPDFVSLVMTATIFAGLGTVAILVGVRDEVNDMRNAGSKTASLGVAAVVTAAALFATAVLVRWAWPEYLYVILGTLLFLVFALGGALKGGYEQAKNAKKIAEAHNAALAVLRKMASDDDLCVLWAANEKQMGIAINDIAKRVSFVTFSPTDSTSVTKSRTVGYSDILDAELIIDNQIVTTAKTTTTGSMKRAIVGGLILGPVGAVAGAVSTPSRTHFQNQDDLRKVELRVLLNDMSDPVAVFPFFSGQLPRSHPTCCSALEMANLWVSRFNLICKPCNAASRVRRDESDEYRDKLVRIGNDRPE